MFQIETKQNKKPRLVIIADDLTGAMDTGVQFTKNGADVHVTAADRLFGPSEGMDVLVIDAETRHLSPEEAYETTFRLAKWAEETRVPHLYIKTDSALRGHIGMAVKAALDATASKTAAFAPAYPEMGRVTRNGRQLIDGVPIQESVFSRDLFNPVNTSRVGDLFLSCGLAVKEYPVGAVLDDGTDEKKVCVFDIETNEDFQSVIGQLRDRGLLRVTAGCAGFAAALYEAMDLPVQKRPAPRVQGPLLVLCGSLNPIARTQLAYGEKMGCARRTCSLSWLLDDENSIELKEQRWMDDLVPLFRKRVSVLLDTGEREMDDITARDCLSRLPLEQVGARIAGRLGRLLLRLLEMPETESYTPMIIGGDTLIGFLRLLKDPDVVLEGEAASGVVVFSLRVNGRRIRMISKSGGLGKENILDDVTRQAG